MKDELDAGLTAAVTESLAELAAEKKKEKEAMNQQTKIQPAEKRELAVQDRAVAVQRQINECARLADELRLIIRDLESEYALARAKTVDLYRRRLEEIKGEANEALGRLDSRYQMQIAESRAGLEALARLRGESGQ